MNLRDYDARAHQLDMLTEPAENILKGEGRILLEKAARAEHLGDMSTKELDPQPFIEALERIRMKKMT
eukprot:5109366-Heterocapsa_arctica.AAC.1